MKTSAGWGGQGPLLREEGGSERQICVCFKSMEEVQDRPLGQRLGEKEVLAVTFPCSDLY